MLKKLLVVVLMAFVAVALVGCAGSSQPGPRSQFVEFTPEQKQDIEFGDVREYQIQEGDVLRVAFSYLKELDQDGVIVLPDGSVTLVGVDRIKLAGLTVSEADDIVTAAYSEEYLSPSLSLIVQETVGRKIYVLGEVTKPGLHELPRGGLDVVGAVAVAGGFTDDAAKSGSVLVRVTPDGYLVQEMDLSEFQSVEYAHLAGISLQSFDVIYVPRSRMGDFGYFSKTVLAGLVSMTRIASDVKYLSGGSFGRVF